MAYIINRFDGTQLAIVDDGILDTSTPLGLLGRNYTGYGEVQNENFIFLLENFANASPPARALNGQAWYDKGAKALKVYNGSTWLSIGNATVSETEPDHSNGGLWLKVTTQQLFVSDGTTWRQVGPEAAEGFAVTKMTSTVIKDTLGANKPVILTQINGETTSIIVNEDFVIASESAIPGFNQLTRGINLKSTSYFSGTLKGNADSATKLETARKINTVDFDGTTDITITSATNQPLKAGDFIIGSEFNGSFETTWDINATSENIIGSIVSRNSVGGFTATIINSDLFGNVQGNITAITGTSTFDQITVNDITGNTFSGVANRATRLEIPRTINTIPFDGTANITLPVPAETLVGTTLAPNVVDSVLTSLGKLVALEVEAPGIKVGDGNNINIFIEGFTPTLESDVSNALKLKLATGSTTVSPTTITFISASAASADGVLSPAFVPDYTLGTQPSQRPVLGLPSYRWKDIYSAAATLDVLKATTLSGRTTTDEVRVSNKLIVNGATYSTLFGNVTGNVVGNVTGAASLNMLKSGDTLTGDIAWTSSGRGLTWTMNTDSASIKYYNTTDNSTDNRLEFNTSDNQDEYFRWTHTTGATTFESMRLTPTANGLANLRVSGQITVTSGISAATYIGDANQLINLNATQLLTGTVPVARLSGNYNISITGNVTGNVNGNVTGSLVGNVTGNVTGASSLNVLKTGDTLSGDLGWSTSGRGLSWGMNSDGASIRFYNIGDGDTGSRLEFQTTDNGNEYFSWTHALSGGGTIESMRLVPNGSGNASLRVYGNATIDGTASGTFSGTGTSLTINASNLTVGTVPSGRLSGTYAINITGNANSATTATTATTVSGGSVNATTGSFSGQVSVSTAGIKFPTDAYGGSGDAATITLETKSGEATTMTFRVTNDADDTIGFFAPTNNGLTMNNHVVVHAANYADYTVTKTGTGASGTWPIDITGNARSVTLLNSSQIVTALGYTPVNSGALTNQAGTAITGTTGSFSGQVNVSTAGIVFPNDPFGGSGDAASISFESVGGERMRLRFRVANDDGISTVDDKAEFIVPDNNSLLINGNIVLNAANYNNYAPTRTGTGASGLWPISITGNAVSVTAVTFQQVTAALGYVPVNPSTVTNSSGSAGNFSSVTASGNIQINKNNPTLFLNHINGADSGIELAISVQGEDFIIYEPDDGNREWFRINDTGSNGHASVYGNTILDSSNYTTYAPTLTGGSASGTWPISISGNAVTVSSVTYQQVVNALGFTPANNTDLSRVTTSPLQASNITTSGTLTVAQGADKGIRWPNDSFGGGYDTARITLETAGGEATRMRFTMTNDADDYFEFSSPNNSGMKMNGYTVLNDGNTYFAYGQIESQYGGTTTYIYPPAGYTMSNLSAFIPSLRTIYFAGKVDGNDSLYTYYSVGTSYITVIVYNSEQRYQSSLNYLGIWRK